MYVARIFKVNFSKISLWAKKFNSLFSTYFARKITFNPDCVHSKIYISYFESWSSCGSLNNTYVFHDEWNTKRAQLIIIGNTFTSRFKPFKLLLWRLWFASFVSKLVDTEITSYLLDILYVISRNFEITFLWFINRSRN